MWGVSRVWRNQASAASDGRTAPVWQPTSATQEQISSDERKEDNRDYAVHGEEGGIELGEIACRHQGMLIGEQDRDGHDSHDRKLAKAEADHECDEREEHDRMKEARHRESGADSEIARHGMQSGFAVEIEILTGIEHIEAPHP